MTDSVVKSEALAERLRVVMGAEVVAQQASGSVVGGGVQKMVVVALLLYEGMPLTLEDLADRTGYHASTVGRAIDALMRRGVVRCEGQMPSACGRPGWSEYRVEEWRL